MPKKKMMFPEVPGDTPRERFMNLVRHVFPVPKATATPEPESKKGSRARVTNHSPNITGFK